MRIGAFLVGVALMFATAGRPVDEKLRPNPPAAPAPAARIFLSGHSLTDAPYPDQMRRVTETLGRPVVLTEQNMFGSTVQARVRGGLLSALREGNRERQAPYDTLIITEQHTLLGNLLWSDTLRNLRLVHDELVSNNPAAQTILFTSWLEVDDKAAPQRWMSYERAADPVWQCVAEWINDSMAAEGRRDRIHVLPAALALVWLAQRGLEEKVPGISDSVRQPAGIMDQILKDDVHPTPKASYFLALVTHAFLYRTPPLGAWSPPDMPVATAKGLQKLAWRFAAGYWAKSRPMSPEACRNYVGDIFAPIYLAYQRDTKWREGGAAPAYLKWARHRVTWPALFRSSHADNPFYRDPDQDREYPQAKP